MVSVRAVAHFERKGWPLRPYCDDFSSKDKTAAAQQKRLERQRAARSVEQQRSPGGDLQRKAGTASPVSTVKKMKLKKKKLRRRARREKRVKREADPTNPLRARPDPPPPWKSPALPSPDVEVLVKKITELRAELGWRVEFSKLPDEDERYKCDPAAWTGSRANRFSG